MMAMDLQLALRAMDGDRELLEQLATIFSEDAPRICSDFEVAVRRQNSQSARLAIHSLKGLAASFFDQQTVDSFSALERSCAVEDWELLANTPVQVLSRIEKLIGDFQKTGLIAKTPE
jgi:HPt (histidine-containing phosphotransfer) domain-containing protein